MSANTSTPVIPTPVQSPRRDQPDKQTVEEKAALALISLVSKMPTSAEQVLALHTLRRGKDLISDVVDGLVLLDERNKQLALQAAVQAQIKPLSQVPAKK